MSHLGWNDRGMLCAWNGREIMRKYTYSDFERYNHECITPSMYHYMANYVREHYHSDDNVEMAAVNAYYNLPVDTRVDMHEQELMNIEYQRERINILLDTYENDYEMDVLMDDLAHYTQEIHEEEQWHA